MIAVLILVAAVAGLIMLALDRARRRGGLCWKPCCASCSGDGFGGTARIESHGGACWDCRATGHGHAPERRFPR